MAFRHRDAFGRVSFVGGQGASREHLIDPKDGRLVRLVVQQARNGSEEEGHEEEDDFAFESHDVSNWTRIGPLERDISTIMALVYWVYSSVLVEGSERRHWGATSTIMLAAKWVPSCVLLAFTLLIPQNLEGEFRNGGYFDPVHYRDWGYQKIPLNRSEANPESEPLLDGDGLETSELEPHSHQEQTTDAEASLSSESDEESLRGFGPRYLCFLRDNSAGETAGYETWKVSDWVQAHEGHGDIDTNYVFISYTRKQFCVATESELSHWDIPDNLRQAYAQLSSANRDALVRYGADVAHSAGKTAFWMDFECIRDIQGVAEASSQSYDVYRICDIVRAASSMTIVVGPPVETQLPGGTPQPYNNRAVTSWLQQWGTRLWTLPEILLCPSEHRITVYAVGSHLPPEQIAKRNFVARAALPDASIVRQLIDHYESSIHLSPLELISLALQSFSVRQTDQFNQGDIAYALMGLLRRRPLVNRDDTGFEAFARLSLANNSERLLERLLCVRTERLDAEWHDTKDAWGMALWDIQPHCQIAGIVDDQTVSLDGAYGAVIQWAPMRQVAFLKRSTVGRTFAKIALRGVPAYFIMGLALTIAAFVIKSNADNSADEATDYDYFDLNTSSSASYAFTPLVVLGLLFLIPSLVIILLSPMMLINIYRGKFWSTQALFIGVEGIPENLGSLERKLFGFNHGRLKWSAGGSSLSRHALSTDGECVALPPAKSQATASDDDRKDGARLFTLIDTYTMVATPFRAVRPPTAVMVCGQEGGMQRAILCSYDWKCATFAREAVVRMSTTVLDRMFRVNRFRFALRRRMGADKHVNGVIPADAERLRASDQHGLGTTTGCCGEKKKFWENRTVDLALIPCMWFVYGIEFGTWPEDSSHRIICGCVTRVSVLALQIANYKILCSGRIGHYLGVAVLIKGIAGLASSVTLLMNEESSFGGDIVLQLLLAASNAVIGPCFVLLTAAWYADTNGGCIVRLLLWASSYPVLVSTISQITAAAHASSRVENAIYAGFAAVCILLSFYIFARIGMPRATMWLVGARQKDRLQRRERWRQHHRSLTLTELVSQPTAWFVFWVKFFGAASAPLIIEVFPSFYLPLSNQELAKADFLVLLPVAAFGFLVITSSTARVPTLVLTASLAYAGQMLLFFHGQTSYGLTDYVAYYYSKARTGLLLLHNMRLYFPYLFWATLLLISSENGAANTSDLIANIVVAFAASALGGVLGYGMLPVLATQGDYWFDPVKIMPVKVFISLMFALQIVALSVWFVWLVWQRLPEWRQKEREGQRTQAVPDAAAELEC